MKRTRDKSADDDVDNTTVPHSPSSVRILSNRLNSHICDGPLEHLKWISASTNNLWLLCWFWSIPWNGWFSTLMNRAYAHDNTHTQHDTARHQTNTRWWQIPINRNACVLFDFIFVVDIWFSPIHFRSVMFRDLELWFSRKSLSVALSSMHKHRTWVQVIEEINTSTLVQKYRKKYLLSVSKLIKYHSKEYLYCSSLKNLSVHWSHNEKERKRERELMRLP